MLKKYAASAVLSAFVLLAPFTCFADGLSTSHTLVNNSPIGTLNPNNMGETDMSSVGNAIPGGGTGHGTADTTYTGTGSIPGSDPLRGNGHYDMSGTGFDGTNGPIHPNVTTDSTTTPDTNTIRPNSYRTMATDSDNSKWGWLGMLGLLGLAGLFGRSRNENRDPI